MSTVALVHYDMACRALAEARTVDEAKGIADKAEALRVYAQQAKNKQLELDAAEIRIRAERRVGELIIEQKATVGLNPGTRGQLSGRNSSGPSVKEVPDNLPPTLKDAGIDYKLSTRSQKIAAIPEEKFEQRLAERREREIATVGDSFLDERPHVSYNSGENEWYTPVEYAKAARDCMGRIDLDPASTEEANQVINAATIYTAQVDGLKHRWAGCVWMNPPYSSELIGKFCDKLVHHYKIEEITSAIVLVNNATETGWFQQVAAIASNICFPSKRIRFWAPNKTTAQPLQGQALFYLGKYPARFRRYFNEFGIVVEVCR